MDTDTLDKIKMIAAEARTLANSDNVFVRVAGERVATILADVLYEIDLDLESVLPILPVALR